MREGTFDDEDRLTASAPPGRADRRLDVGQAGRGGPLVGYPLRRWAAGAHVGVGLGLLSTEARIERGRQVELKYANR